MGKEGCNMELQKYKSDKTSVRKVSAVYTNYEFEKGAIVFDYGCGRFFEDTINFMKSYNVHMIGYDPYNRTKQENDKALKEVKAVKPQYIVCSCVLNVIMENEIIKNILTHIQEIAGEETKVIFNIYQGDRTRNGKVTSCGYQRNEPTRDYVKLIEEFFEVSKIKGQFIEVFKYKEQESQAV